MKSETMRVYYVLMILVYAASRLYFSNLHASVESLYSHWQMLDIAWLQNDLWGSLYYLHSQPPFYNFLIGVFAKLFPQSYPEVLSVLYLLLSLGIYVMMFRILLFFRLPGWLAFAAATLYILTPEALLYERWIFYTWFNAFLLVSALFVLVRYLDTERQLYLLLFFLYLAMLMLTRSLFHLIFLPGVVLLLVWMDKRAWKRVVGYSLIPLVLVGGLYMKNYLTFGFFGGSSWLGMNLARVATHATLDHSLGELMHMPYAQKEQEMKMHLEKLYREKKIHSPMLVGAFKPLDTYEKSYRNKIPLKFQHIPMLTEELKSSEYRNLNHYDYLAISADMKKDDLTLIAGHPAGYARTVAMALMNYIRPAWDYLFVEENAGKIRRYIKRFELEDLGGTLKGKYGLISVLLLPLMIVFGVVYAAVLLYHHSRKRAAAALFALYSILFVMGIGILVEIGELNRMRVMTDPLLFILGTVALTAGLRWIFVKRT